VPACTTLLADAELPLRQINIVADGRSDVSAGSIFIKNPRLPVRLSPLRFIKVIGFSRRDFMLSDEAFCLPRDFSEPRPRSQYRPSSASRAAVSNPTLCPCFRCIHVPGFPSPAIIKICFQLTPPQAILYAGPPAEEGVSGWFIGTPQSRAAADICEITLKHAYCQTGRDIFFRKEKGRHLCLPFSSYCLLWFQVPWIRFPACSADNARV
jgi:hypothetical protein